MVQGARQSTSLEVVAADPQDRDSITAAIDLGNEARTTLGHLPWAAYDAAAVDGTLLLARLDERVVGYALYALARNRVRLTHLCVDPSARAQGIARKLIDEISSRHRERLGILARCRNDYGLAPVWLSLGFTPLGEKRGRGKTGQPLTIWWRDHQHEHLYSIDPETVLVRAAIDMNILRNLMEQQRPRHDEAVSLVEDHLSDRLQLFRTQSLDAEIQVITGKLRQDCLQKIQSWPNAPRDEDRFDEIRASLLAEAVKVIRGYPRSTQDEFDLMHVANAIAADLNVFVTVDNELIRVLGPEAQRQGTRILRPVDVVVRIDELSRAESYRPIELQNTAFTERLIASGEDESVGTLANTTAGEKPKVLIQAARTFATSGTGERVGVFNPGGELVAYYGVRQDGDVLSILNLRVSEGPIGETLIRQILFRLRHQALARNVRVLSIDGESLQRKARVAAIEDGFLEANGRLHAFVIDQLGDASTLEHLAVQAARIAAIDPPPPLRQGMHAIAASELERVWWPAKLADSQLPSYLIPIKQDFSVELLGVPSSLYPRSDSLGLNREHVYYRRRSSWSMDSPARLLWYMSGGKGKAGAAAAIIACSQLDAVHHGPPEELHSRFQHLGVWNLSNVIGAARNGVAEALRFTNTELFPRPVSLRRLAQLGTDNGVSGAPPQSPRRISPDLFAAIYTEGMAR
ncbi:GNAT family N-acetyltransferase [Kribbella sp. NPDC023855]|uniref:GNAT family N-acetyltransferase n=1 Tax=Kribbella sp. NPDC023855 TaxID=3154698 RepID=UPI0033C345B6